MSEDPTPTPTPPAGSARREPNYAARRMLVTTVAIMAVVAFAVVGWAAIRSDDEGTVGSAGTWKEIALVDRTSGEVTIVDDEGETVGTFIGRGRVGAVHAHGDRLALVGAEQIVVEGGDEPVVIPIERSNTVTPIHTPDTLHLVIGTTTGGNVTVIDVDNGELLDIGAIAEQQRPRLFAETIRWSDDGQRFAVADAEFFRTIVVEAGSDRAQFFAAQPVALDDERVATSQVISRQADIELFDRDRASEGRVATEIPAGGVMVDGDLMMVATTGGVFRVSTDNSEAERIGEVAVPSGGTVDWVRPSLEGSRLVVSGSVFQAVIDLDGRTLFTTTFTTPTEVEPPRPAWMCLPVGGGDTYHSIVSLESGEQLADLSGVTVTGTSSDGCTVIGERDDLTEVISADGSVALGRVRSATLGPDGRTVVRTTTSGATEILRIDDELAIGDSIDLTELAPTNPIVAFLD